MAFVLTMLAGCSYVTAVVGVCSARLASCSGQMFMLRWPQSGNLPRACVAGAAEPDQAS